MRPLCETGKFTQILHHLSIGSLHSKGAFTVLAPFEYSEPLLKRCNTCVNLPVSASTPRNWSCSLLHGRIGHLAACMSICDCTIDCRLLYIRPIRCESESTQLAANFKLDRETKTATYSDEHEHGIHRARCVRMSMVVNFRTSMFYSGRGRSELNKVRQTL